MTAYAKAGLSLLLFVFLSIKKVQAEPVPVPGSEPRLDEILVVVHKDSVLEKLSLRELKAIYLGRSLNLPVAPIVIDYKPDNPLREVFYEYATGRSIAYSVRNWARYAFSGQGYPPVIVASPAEIAKLLEQNSEQFIAYLEREYLSQNMKVVITLTGPF